MNIKITKEMVRSLNEIQFGHMLKAEETKHEKEEYLYIYMCPHSYEFYIGNGSNPKEAIENRKQIDVNAYSYSPISKFLCNLERYGICEHNFVD